MIKTHKLIVKNLTYSRHLLKFGSYGLKVLSDLRLNKEQIESLNRSLQRKVKTLSNYSKKIKIWDFLQPNKTLTKLSLESRMGKGKGSIYTEVLFMKKGSIIYEFDNMKSSQVIEIFNFIKKQFSVEVKLINKK